MKSTSQIIEFINKHFEVATDIPERFFRNTEHMEMQLAAFEELYEFIVAENEGPQIRFCEFLVANGYGALGFSRGKVEESRDEPPIAAPSIHEVEKMKALGQFWREYLASDLRLRPRESSM